MEVIGFINRYGKYYLDIESGKFKGIEISG
jgi:hypothetical protein